MPEHTDICQRGGACNIGKEEHLSLLCAVSIVSMLLTNLRKLIRNQRSLLNQNPYFKFLLCESLVEVLPVG